MMILLLLLLQDIPASRPLDEAIAAFANGEESARKEILKAGASSMLPLRKLRDRAPGRIASLLYDLKKGAAPASEKPRVDAMEEKRSIDAKDMAFPAAIDELGKDFSLLFDPALFRTHYEKTVNLQFKDRPRREIFDAFCAQIGLDYGFFFGVVLIAAPERLWPMGPPPRSTPLTADEARRAALLLPRLSDNQAGERDQASAALRAFGSGVIPLLEEKAAAMDVEGQARCQDLIRQLKKPAPEGIFHVPAAARQALAGADAELRNTLAQQQVSFKVQDIVLDGAMKLMLLPRNVPIQLAPSLCEARVTLDCQNQTSWALIGLATQTCGFDFLIVDGTVVMDRREEIERRLASGR